MLDTSLPVRSVWLRYNHKKLLITICHSNYPPFVIPLIPLVIPMQEESIIILCHSTYPSCHSDAGGIYHYSLLFHLSFLPFRRRRNLSLPIVIPIPYRC